MDNDRAALWMGLGLGKTATTLWALNDLFNSFKCTGALVIAPLRVINLTWPAEIEKWDEFRWMKYSHIMTKRGWDDMEQGKSQIYLINWDNIDFLAKHFLHGKRWFELPFDTVIFDESTRAKNPESKRVNTFRAYINKFKRRWELTGTPSPNSLQDLFAQIRLLDDGKRLGVSFDAFRKTYFIEEGYMGYSWRIRPGSADQIHQKVSDIALVLKSSDFLDVPDTVIHDIDVPLPVACKGLYNELSENLLALTDKNEEIVAVNKAVLTNKLLQVTGGAVYLEQQYNERGMPLPRLVSQLHDAKIKALVTLCKKLRPQPVLISCVFLHEQDRIVASLSGAVRFDSAGSASAQLRLVDKWNAGQIPYLVAHPKSTGHGLNLQQGGNNIIWYGFTWSREDYDQLNARLARTGQTKVPEIYRLISPGTMDDAVVETLESNGEVQNALLNAVENYRKLRQKTI